MYETHFGFHRQPFQASDAIRSFFESQTIRSAIPLLRHAIRSDPGVAVITGPSGVGKSCLLKHLQHDLVLDGRSFLFSAASLASPAELRESLLAATRSSERDAGDGGIDSGHPRISHWSLREKLIRTTEFWGPLLLLIDDAHLLPVSVLNEIRAFVDNGSDSGPLLRAIIAGPLRLEEDLARPTHAEFSSRVRCHVLMEPLTTTEAARYLRHQIAQVGGDPGQVFDRAAVEAILAAAGGIPRCINLLADESLLEAATQGLRTAEAACVATALRRLIHLPYDWNVSLAGIDDEELADPGSPSVASTAAEVSSAASPAAAPRAAASAESANSSVVEFGADSVEHLAAAAASVDDRMSVVEFGCDPEPMPAREDATAVGHSPSDPTSDSDPASDSDTVAGSDTVADTSTVSDSDTVSSDTDTGLSDTDTGPTADVAADAGIPADRNASVAETHQPAMSVSDTGVDAERERSATASTISERNASAFHAMESGAYESGGSAADAESSADGGRDSGDLRSGRPEGSGPGPARSSRERSSGRDFSVGFSFGSDDVGDACDVGEDTVEISGIRSALETIRAEVAAGGVSSQATDVGTAEDSGTPSDPVGMDSRDLSWVKERAPVCDRYTGIALGREELLQGISLEAPPAVIDALPVSDADDDEVVTRATNHIAVRRESDAAIMEWSTAPRVGVDVAEAEDIAEEDAGDAGESRGPAVDPGPHAPAPARRGVAPTFAGPRAPRWVGGTLLAESSESAAPPHGGAPRTDAPWYDGERGSEREGECSSECDSRHILSLESARTPAEHTEAADTAYAADPADRSTEASGDVDERFVADDVDVVSLRDELSVRAAGPDAVGNPTADAGAAARQLLGLEGPEPGDADAARSAENSTADSGDDGQRHRADWNHLDDIQDAFRPAGATTGWGDPPGVGRGAPRLFDAPSPSGTDGPGPRYERLFTELRKRRERDGFRSPPSGD